MDSSFQRILILFGSASGTAQEYAERIARDSYKRVIEYEICAMNEYDPSVLPNESVVIFLASTTGDGEAPSNMLNFWKYLLQSTLPQTWLNNLPCIVMGLGDSSYEKFNYVGKRLYRRLEQLNASFIMERLDGDEQHPFGHDSVFSKLMEALWPWLETAFHLNIDLKNESGPRVTLSSVKLSGQEQVEQILPHKVQITQNLRLTSRSHFQDVRHIVLNANVLPQYTPGDVVILQPWNSDKDVDDLIKILGWQSIQGHFLVSPARKECRLPPNLSNSPVTIRNILKYYLDIISPPKKYFFEILSRFVDKTHPDSLMHQEKLMEISSPAGADLYLDYVWRPKRSPFEIIDDFPITGVGLEYIFDLFAPLRPREYSISSSSLAHPGEVHVTAALVEYKTNLIVPRRGVCSRWLNTLPLGSEISIDIRKGTWSLPSSGPIILIAAGTGIAPMRAIIHHINASDRQQKVYLFFGCRFLAADFHYKDEWTNLTNVSVFAMGSRDLPGSRRYISDLMRENNELIRTLLIEQDGTVYVAGNSKLPMLVKKTIIEITNDPNLPSKMVKDNRLFIESWS